MLFFTGDILNNQTLMVNCWVLFEIFELNYLFKGYFRMHCS